MLKERFMQSANHSAVEPMRARLARSLAPFVLLVGLLAAPAFAQEKALELDPTQSDCPLYAEVLSAHRARHIHINQRKSEFRSGDGKGRGFDRCERGERRKR